MKRARLLSLLFACALGVLPPATAIAQLHGTAPRIDETTGQDLAHWPKPRHFDHLSMKLELDISQVDPPKIEAHETLRLTPLGQTRDQIRLDAVGLDIHNVDVRKLGLSVPPTNARRRAAWSYDGTELVIPLTHPAVLDDVVEVSLDYAVTKFDPKGAGLSWEPPVEGATGPSESHGVIYSQGEAEYNSQWFACHDFPNERLTTELIVSAPKPFSVVSNGRLVERTDLGDGRERWHWLQDKPHAPYLVTLVVGVLNRVEVGGDDSARPGLPIGVWTPVGTEDSVRAGFSDTPAMIAYFEKLFDEPFAWDKYDQVITRGFDFGAMENTTATTFYPQAAHQSKEELRDFISHELAHHWFGDLVTCKSWEHLWLNEGFASFCEALWAEEEAGDDPAARREAYLEVVRGWLAGSRMRDRATAPGDAAMASNYYADGEQIFGKPDNVYSKGALVLHMLRIGLGDDAFFRGMRLYLNRYRFKCAETDDFRHAMEDASGRSLEKFFDEWVTRPGMPRLDVAFDASGDTLMVHTKQTQPVDALNPAYEFLLPIWVTYADGRTEYFYMHVDDVESDATFALNGDAVNATPDPNMTIFANYHVTKSIGSDAPEEQDEGREPVIDIDG